MTINQPDDGSGASCMLNSVSLYHRQEIPGPSCRSTTIIAIVARNGLFAPPALVSLTQTQLTLDGYDAQRTKSSRRLVTSFLICSPHSHTVQSQGYPARHTFCILFDDFVCSTWKVHYPGMPSVAISSDQSITRVLVQNQFTPFPVV